MLLGCTWMSGVQRLVQQYGSVIVYATLDQDIFFVNRSRGSDSTTRPSNGIDTLCQSAAVQFMEIASCVEASRGYDRFLPNSTRSGFIKTIRWHRDLASHTLRRLSLLLRVSIASMLPSCTDQTFQRSPRRMRTSRSRMPLPARLPI